MSIGTDFLPEFDLEMAGTRRALERVPDQLLQWKAHEKSNTIGWVANHLAETPGWLPGTFAGSEWDIAPVDGEPYQSPAFDNMSEILALFDQNVAEARETLEEADDEAMKEDWSLKAGGNVLFTTTRENVIRRWMLNHSIHHRGHLCVYLRLNDIAVPPLYGPSGDEEG